MKLMDKLEPIAVSTGHYKFGFTPFLSELSDEGFVHIKQTFIAERRLVLDSLENRYAADLLDVLCEPGLLSDFDRQRFDSVVSSLVHDTRLYAYALEKYIADLIDVLDKKMIDESSKQEVHDDYQYLSDLVAECKESIYEANIDEVVKYMVDIYKLVTCLGEFADNTEYAFKVDRFALNRTNYGLIDYYNDAYHELLDLVKLKEKHGVGAYGQLRVNYESYREQLRYSFVLSCILGELICDQDGIVKEVEDNINE